MDKERKRIIQEAFDAGVYRGFKDAAKVVKYFAETHECLMREEEHGDCLDYIGRILAMKEPAERDIFKQLLEDANGA